MTYILETMSAEVKGFLYTALVDMEMAAPIGEISAPGAVVNGLQAATVFTDMVRNHMKNLECLGDEVMGRTTDIIITTDRYQVIVHPMADVMCCQVLFLRNEGSLGFARATIQRYSDSIRRAMRGEMVEGMARR